MSQGAIGIDEAVQQQIRDLADIKKDDSNWGIFIIDDQQKDEQKRPKLVQTASGKGGLSELVAALDDSAVQFAGLLATGVDVQENLTSTRPKFIFITFIEPNVPSLLRPCTKPSASPDVSFTLRITAGRTGQPVFAPKAKHHLIMT